MVTTASSQQLYRFTVHYHEIAGLSRILDALFRAGAEPSWLFTRLSRKNGFRLDIRIGMLSAQKVATLAERLRVMPAVQAVKFKACADDEASPRRPAAPVSHIVLSAQRKDVA